MGRPQAPGVASFLQGCRMAEGCSWHGAGCSSQRLAGCGPAESACRSLPAAAGQLLPAGHALVGLAFQ